jgi:hypothetical protein
MTVSHTLLLVLALATPQPSPIPTPSSSVSGSLIVRGQLLTITSTYLLFTTGDAVHLGSDTRIAAMLHLGQPIRVRFDPISHHVHSVEAAFGKPMPGEIDAAQLPREYITVDAASLRLGAHNVTAQQARVVTVTFTAHVPDDTPATDDIYISTDRSNFSPAELKMNRIDVRRWNITLPLVEGTTLHYQYTRGNYATVERDASGGTVTPRILDVHEGERTEDTVARWADTS